VATAIVATNNCANNNCANNDCVNSNCVNNILCGKKQACAIRCTLPKDVHLPSYSFFFSPSAADKG
jgi:hypothetical protein